VLEDESLCKTLPIKDGFVYGNLIYNDKQPYIVGPIAEVNDEYCSMEWWCPVKPETVGQFSGKRDKGKRLIFEGDIVVLGNDSVHPGYLYVISFLDGAFCVGLNNGETFGDFCSIRDGMSQARKYDKEFSICVVGTIHDNPELLEA